MSIQKLWLHLVQFFKFSLVGLSNTIISYFIYSVLIWLGFHYIFSNIVGFLISILNAFYWNNKYVFKKEVTTHSSLHGTFTKCFISYSVTNICLASLLLYIWIDLIALSPYLAQLINLCITVPLNFFLNKFWVFKNHS